jgi:hypothetical protein
MQLISKGSFVKNSFVVYDFLTFPIIQSNLSYVTLQGNSEIWSHKTGHHLIQV